MACPILGGVGRPALLLVVLFCLRAVPAWAQETTEAGLNDLVVLDPGKHELGLPSVELKKLKNAEGVVEGLEIDIPPKVHVHRYYYSGDKIYQGPIIQGGPTVVVANHPKTGERVYVDVVLPAGAPRIAYSRHAITYIYGDKRVEVKFQHFPRDPSVAVVKHHHGKGWRRHIHDSRKHIKEHVKEELANSQMVNSVKELSKEGHDIFTGITASFGELSSTGSDGLKTLTGLIPGVTYLKSLAEQKPNNDYASQIRTAGIAKEANEPKFLPTNR